MPLLSRLLQRSGFAATLLLTSLLASAATAARPNIILLLPDQMRASAMGVAGNPDVQSPHIDQMAREGIRFKRTYANVPVCCPARAILLTGTYPHVNGMMANDLRLRESETTIAELLRDAGYRTGFVGKWHLDGGPREPGFIPPGPRRQGFEFWAAYECHHQHFLPYYFRDTPEMILVRKFEPEASCDFAVEFIKAQPAGRPFFLMMQMGPPHDPYGAPDEYMKRYDPEKITPPKSWQPNSEIQPARNAIPPRYQRPDLPGGSYVRTGGKEEIAAYYAAITAIDDQVGRLLQTLKETGQDENTIILFTSDHGDMLGSHGMRRKRKPHEESAGVPGIIRWPAKIPAGRVVDTLFSHVDMPATLLGLAGLTVPKHMQGADLSRVARGETTAGPDAVLLQIFVPYRPDQITRPWRGVITDRYTYARYENEPWVLFDHQRDPHQMNNLAADPAHARIRGELEARLAALMAAKGDAWSFNSNELVEEDARLYGKQTYYSIQEYLTSNPAAAGKSR
ncbi:sulfatase family protein [Horticoccus sp. 23ND18S-11]|uniref:sulfatase family protein n=1 Tax=Horticoccus sp. 23ND18S-11 TaxID=3391832 RepID=UPI0039C986BF